MTTPMTERSAYRWFPWGIAAAMALVVAVNLALTYFAFSSSTGLVTEHPYDEGNGYNAVLEAGAREDALGWKAAIAFDATGKERGEITATLKDRTGRPLTDLAVTAHLSRPVEPLPPIVVKLHDDGAGHYAAAAALGRPGQWNVRIVARRGGELYEFSDRIFVP
jgi:nitrogen fixation protein FixH